jgi:hypothetical protein
MYITTRLVGYLMRGYLILVIMCNTDGGQREDTFSNIGSFHPPLALGLNLKSCLEEEKNFPGPKNPKNLKTAFTKQNRATIKIIPMKH